MDDKDVSEMAATLGGAMKKGSSSSNGRFLSATSGSCVTSCGVQGLAVAVTSLSFVV